MKIPLPERGQPIDLNYLYQIASSINDLSNQVSTSNTTSRVDNGINPPEDVTSNKLRFYAITTRPIVVGNVNAGTSQNWSADFQPDFLFTPVVTATVQNNTASTAGNNVTLVIRNITTNKVEGNVLYNIGGSINISINVIAIGVSR